MKKRLLIIEAHSDDSAISASGFLEKHRDLYEYHFIVTTMSDFHLHHSGVVSRERRLKEYEFYVRHFSGTWHRVDDLPYDCDARLDTRPKCELVAAYERVLAETRPDVLVLQGPSFHHDHTIVYEAAIAATRPTALFCPKEIYVMENPTYVHSLGPLTDFRPNLYCTLTEEEMKQKIECFKTCFPSQIREDKNYLSPEGISAWARYRGIECRSLYAEAFQTYIRVV